MEYSRYLTAICPECLGELVIPRPPAELQGGDGNAVLVGQAKVCDKKGKDVTPNFIRGAERALRLAKKNKVQVAILKANSPSCGNKQIYDGSFSDSKIPGQGVTAALLTQNGIKVYSEKELTEDMLQRIIAMYKEEK